MFYLVLLLLFNSESTTIPPSKEVVESTLTFFKEEPEKALENIKGLGYTPYDFGLLAGQTDSEGAILFYKKLMIINPEEKLNYSYGIAWIYWVNLELISAHNELSYLLTNNPNPKLMARIHYLFGLIYARTEEYENAEKHTKKSLEIYEELKLKGGVVNCLVVLGAISFDKKDMVVASRFLEEASKLNNTRTTPQDSTAKIDYYKANIFLRKFDNRQALEHYLKVIHNPYSQETFIQLSKTNASVCNWLLRDAVTAVQYAKDVDDFVRANHKEDSLYAHYNQIAWILINRCQGVVLNNTIKKTLEWNDDRGEARDIRDMLDFVQTIKCPD